MRWGEIFQGVSFSRERSKGLSPGLASSRGSGVGKEAATEAGEEQLGAGLGRVRGVRRLGHRCLRLRGTERFARCLSSHFFLSTGRSSWTI